MATPFTRIPWLLATGQGRSGTTVLTRALAEHPDVCSNRVESNVLKDILLAGYASSTMTSRVRQMVLARDEHDAAFRRFVTELLFPVSLWKGSGAPAALSTFSAMNAEAAEFAVAALQGIHFANIVRNGVEVVASRRVHRSLGEHTFEENCVAWAAAAEMVQWGHGRDDFTLIRHEELLDADSCREVMAQLLERAGLSNDDGPANYILQRRRNQTTYEEETGDEAGDLKCRANRWRHWTADERAMFRDLCTPTMELLGYVIPDEL